MKFVIWLTCLLSTVYCAVLGIDFGQEFTKGVLVAPGVAFEIVLSQDSKRKDVSGIVFKDISAKDGSSKSLERVYGNAASGLVNRFADSTAFYLKSLLGQSFEANDNVARFVEQQPGAQLRPTKNNRNSVSMLLHGELYPVEELVAMTFADIKARADSMLKANKVQDYIKGATITVPAHFTIEQRYALQDAAEISGLKLISLVNDGVAVAVNYASTRQFGDRKEYFIVYDQGAGSTTATLVSIRQGEVPLAETNSTKQTTIIEVEGLGYDTQLGGHLLTSRVRDYMIEEFVSANPTVKRADLTKDAKAMNKLWREAERVKFVLSANTEVRSSVESLYDGALDFKLKISRDTFESLVNDQLPRVTRPIQDALVSLDGNTSIDISAVNSIILAGGSTRVPFVQQQLQSFVQDSVKISKNVNADEAAVLGATLRGIGISKIFKSRDIEVIDKNLYEIEVEVNGVKTVVFPKGAPVDTVETIPIGTTKDFSLTVLQAGNPIVSYNASKVKASLGELKTCLDEAVIEAELFLTTSHTVELRGITAHCTAEEKVPIKKKPVSESETDITEARAETETETVPEPKEEKETTEFEVRTKIVSRNLIVKPKYSGFRPMGSSSKQNASARLRALDFADRTRIAREHARNELESSYYNARSLVEHDESKLAEINEIGDWLDTESESATLEVLQAKIEEVEAIVNRKDEPPQAVEEADPTKTKAAGENMVTPFVLPSNAMAGDAIKSSLTAEFNSLANQFDNLFQMFSNLGLDLSKKQEKKEKAIGVDFEKVDQYMDGELDTNDSTVDVIQDTAGLVGEMLGLERDAKGNVIDKARFSELLQSIEDQKTRIQDQQTRAQENRSKRIDAISRMAEAASNSMLVNEMLASEKSLRQEWGETQGATTTTAIEHDDL